MRISSQGLMDGTYASGGKISVASGSNSKPHLDFAVTSLLLPQRCIPIIMCAALERNDSFVSLLCSLLLASTICGTAADKVGDARVRREKRNTCTYSLSKQANAPLLEGLTEELSKVSFFGGPYPHLPAFGALVSRSRLAWRAHGLNRQSSSYGMQRFPRSRVQSFLRFGALISP